MISVLVVDDHPTIRRSLQTLLETVAGIRCVGTAPNGMQAIALAERHLPDVVVMDVSMSGSDGIDATVRIRDRWPRTKVIALADWGSARLRARALDAGASAHLLKDCDPDVLLGAIRTAAAS